MAEFVMKDIVDRHGMSDAFRIASAATHNDEIGSPVHYGTREILDSVGISCAGKTARRLKQSDSEEWDIFIGMDKANIKNMKQQLSGEAADKIHLLLEFAHSTRDVAVPWYTGDFETTYDDVVAGCTGLYAWLTGDKSSILPR